MPSWLVTFFGWLLSILAPIFIKKVEKEIDDAIQTDAEEAKQKEEIKNAIDKYNKSMSPEEQENALKDLIDRTRNG